MWYQRWQGWVGLQARGQGRGQGGGQGGGGGRGQGQGTGRILFYSVSDIVALRADYRRQGGRNRGWKLRRGEGGGTRG